MNQDQDQECKFSSANIATLVFTINGQLGPYKGYICGLVMAVGDSGLLALIRNYRTKQSVDPLSICRHVKLHDS